jgi:tRNA threonylcarbamoyladenosine biosynthesis protein TsaB
MPGARILALDTTSAFGSIALFDDGQILEEMPLYSPDGFSQTVFDHLGRLLERHSLTPGEIDCFAAASGPGSFTGVRVGVTAAKGLAEATGRGAVAVSNLEALASCGTAKTRAVLADARRGEVYCAVYDDSLHPVQEEAVMAFPAFVANLPGDTGEIICPDFSPFRAAFNLTIPVIEQRTLAAAVARIASRRRACDPVELDANYVRRADAELKWSE